MNLKGWKRLWFLALITSCFGSLVVLWVAAGRIASPERRELQGYHREFLETSGEHGVVVTEFTFLEGDLPSLVVPAGCPE